MSRSGLDQIVAAITDAGTASSLMAPANMDQEQKLTRSELETPRAAAVAGIVFSLLLLVSLTIIRIAVPEDPQDAGSWLAAGSRNVSFALSLLPFAGIAFLWFIGVVRDRLGKLEDRLFATVFLGSGLLFLATLFAGAGMTGSILHMYGTTPDLLIKSGVYSFGRTAIYEIINVYAMRMAGVFMISTCTLSLRTGILPRWMTYLGLVLALLLLLSVGSLYWIPVVFPLWVLLISVHILVANLRQA